MKDVEQVVHRTILELARQRGADISQVNNEDHLTSHLGLQSLDLARMVALLELEFGVDPFAELVAITDIRTVGDVGSAYQRALQPHAVSHDDGMLDASRARGERRRRSSTPSTDAPSVDPSAE